MCKSVISYFIHLPMQIAIGLIKFYHYCLSPFIGKHCRFYPSCSSYAQEALENYGFLKGNLLTIKRLLRCHPWHPGCFDSVPNASEKYIHHQESLARTSWICKEHS